MQTRGGEQNSWNICAQLLDFCLSFTKGQLKVLSFNPPLWIELYLYRCSLKEKEEKMKKIEPHLVCSAMINRSPDMLYIELLLRLGLRHFSVIRLALFSLLRKYLWLLYCLCVCNVLATFFLFFSSSLARSGGLVCEALRHQPGWGEDLYRLLCNALPFTQRTELRCLQEPLYKALNLPNFTLFPELSQLARQLRVGGL